jgi:hypothetical protein
MASTPQVPYLPDVLQQLQKDKCIKSENIKTSIQTYIPHQSLQDIPCNPKSNIQTPKHTLPTTKVKPEKPEEN